MLRLNSRVAIAALAALAAGACFAQAEKPAPLTGEAAAIKKNLEQKFPGAEVRGVSKTQYFGLYEVQLDDRILYTDAKSKYIMIGAMYDTDAKVNLTEERQRKLNRAHRFIQLRRNLNAVICIARRAISTQLREDRRLAA